MAAEAIEGSQRGFSEGLARGLDLGFRRAISTWRGAMNRLETDKTPGLGLQIIIGVMEVAEAYSSDPEAKKVGRPFVKALAHSIAELLPVGLGEWYDRHDH